MKEDIVEVVTYRKNITPSIKQGKRYRVLPWEEIEGELGRKLTLYLPSCRHLNNNPWIVYLNGVKVSPRDKRVRAVIWPESE
jgi:hypothetical protein